MTTKLVRIKPNSPRARYWVSGDSRARFEKRLGWYEVPQSVANSLAAVRLDPYNRNSPHVFDVCDHSVAQALDEADRIVEAKAKEPMTPYREAPRTAENPIPVGVVTSKQLDPEPIEPEPEPEIEESFEISDEDEDDGKVDPKIPLSQVDPRKKNRRQRASRRRSSE